MESYPYQFTGHEKDGETNYQYHGARYYDEDLARYMSVDPLAQQYHAWSTYNYVMGNPVRLVDPTGKGPTDWIKNLKTGDYVWNKDVTSKDNTPEGYKYVGKNDDDIVKDLFGKTIFSSETTDYGVWKIENEAGNVVPFFTKIFTHFSVVIRPSVAVEGDKRTFNGVDFVASASGTGILAGASQYEQLNFVTESIKFNGVMMDKMIIPDGADQASAQAGSGPYTYHWSAQRIKSHFNESFTRKVTLDGQYRSGDFHILYPTIMGVGKANPTSTSLIIPFNNH